MGLSREKIVAALDRQERDGDNINDINLLRTLLECGASNMQFNSFTTWRGNGKGNLSFYPRPELRAFYDKIKAQTHQ